ncbi:hypothetical protein [Bradyrhizobium guangdongense]
MEHTLFPGGLAVNPPRGPDISAMTLSTSSFSGIRALCLKVVGAEPVLFRHLEQGRLCALVSRQSGLTARDAFEVAEFSFHLTRLIGQTAAALNCANVYTSSTQEKEARFGLDRKSVSHGSRAEALMATGRFYLAGRLRAMVS